MSAAPRLFDPLNPPPAYVGQAQAPEPLSGRGPARAPSVEELSAMLISTVVAWREARVREAAGHTERYAGRHLSELELRIWQVLEHGPLVGKQIAARLGRGYDHILKVILPNLEERGVLDHDKRGYRRGELWPARGTT